MDKYVKEVINALRILLKSIKGYIINFVSKLSKGVKDGNFYSTLTSSIEDENAWVINSGASRHMIGECGHIKTL